MDTRTRDDVIYEGAFDAQRQTFTRSEWVSFWIGAVTVLAVLVWLFR